MLYILIMLIFVRPFISSLAFPFQDAVYSTTLFFATVFWLKLKRFPLNKIKRIKYQLFLFVLALIISVFFSLDKTMALKEIFKYACGLAIFLVGISLEQDEKKKIRYSVVFLGFIIGMLAIHQYYFGFHYLSNYISEKEILSPFLFDYITQRRVFFPFVTPNALAGYLILVIPLALSVKDRSKWFIICFLLLALLLTKSLGAILSLFLGICLFLYLRAGQPRKRFLLLTFMAACLAFIFFLRESTTKAHLTPSFSLLMRLDYWKDSLLMIKTHPLTGVGIGNFNLPASRYAHNSYLQIWAEMGILGILSFILLIGKILKISFEVISPDTTDNGWHTQASIACVAFLIHNLFDFNFFLPEVSLLWWLILGMVYSDSVG